MMAPHVTPIWKEIENLIHWIITSTIQNNLTHVIPSSIDKCENSKTIGVEMQHAAIWSTSVLHLQFKSNVLP